MLKVTNVLTGDERDDLATTKTDKKHHGLGLSGMREIAQRYGGTLEKKRLTAVVLYFWPVCR